MSFFINNRGLVFVVTLIITAIFGVFIALNFEMDSSITAVLPKDDPDFVYNTEIGNVFGSSEDVYISVAADKTIYSVEGLNVINQVSDMLKEFQEKASDGTYDSQLKAIKDTPGFRNFIEPDRITSIISIAKQATELSPNSEINLQDIDSKTVDEIKLIIENNPISKGKIVSLPKYYDSNDTEVNIHDLIAKEFDDYKAEFIAEYDKAMEEYNNVEDKRSVIKPYRKSDETLRLELQEKIQEEQKIDERHKMTIITVPTIGDVGFNDKKLEFLVQKSLKPQIAAINSKNPGFTVELTGQPVVKSDITKYMLNDLLFLFPISVIVVLLIILFMLKSLKGTLIPIIVTIISVIWTFGFKFMFGSPVTMTESVIPVVLISVACADGIHITNQALYFIDRGVPGKAAVYDAMSLVSLPVILASLTTAVGFGSLITAPGVSLKNMGIYLAFGVLSAMVLSLVLIPAIISFFKTPSPRRIASNEKKNNRFRFTKKLRPMTAFILRHKWIMALITLLFVGLSIPGIILVKSDTNEITYFKADAPVRIATQNIEKNLGGINTLYIVIENTELIELFEENKIPIIPHINPPMSFAELEKLEKLTPAQEAEFERFEKISKLKESFSDDPDKDTKVFNKLLINAKNYRLIDKLEQELEQHQAVSSILSYTSYIKLLNFYLSNSKTFNDFSLPRSSGYIRNIQNQLKNGDMQGLNINEYISADGTRMCMRVRINDSNSASIQQVKDLLTFKDENDPNAKNWEEQFEDVGLKIRYAGDNVRIRNGEIIVQSQVISLISALILIIVLLSLMFRSIVSGLIISIPVILAIFLNFTIMLIAGISLNPATSIIASVGMGVGIDYSIHFYSRFRNVYQIKNNYREALIEAAVQSSSGIVSNAIAVGTGFLVLMFSSYTIIQQMGWMIALSMFTSALGALTILPALLYIFKPKVKTERKRRIFS